MRGTTGKPHGAPQLIPRLQQVRPELDRLAKERLRVVEHFTLVVHLPQVQVRVQRRFGILVQADRARKMLDGFTVNLLAQAHVADVRASERIPRIAHQHIVKRQEGTVIMFLQHLSPAEQRLRFVAVRCKFERAAQRRFRMDRITERKQ
jgi:hypothetical protein